MASSDSTMDAKTLITQLKGYLLDSLRRNLFSALGIVSSA
jgi:hypothetical protein